MKIQVHSTIESIRAADWNRLAGSNPFLQHEFLAALEHSGCTTAQTGWQPTHLTCTEPQGRLSGALPLFLKSHSYGEYVFDWAWADAWARLGLRYYPKLTAAVPFSPVTGPRLLLGPRPENREVVRALIAQTQDMATSCFVSSIHCLFLESSEAQQWIAMGFMLRKGCQLRWQNRGFQCFDDYLNTLSADKRKKIRRERRRIRDAGIHHQTLTGHELDDRNLASVCRFYSATYIKHGRPAYLNQAFFAEIRRTLPASLVVTLAFKGSTAIAAAVCFRDADTLYGRHWGCEQEFHSLHFETCYYQGIDYCIRERMSGFDPGTQGAHKLSRGFKAGPACSTHWIAEPALRKPIADALQRDNRNFDARLSEMNEPLPFGGIHSAR